MPILFPIAVLTYIIFYCLERYSMAYTYQLPPSLDDRLTINAVKVLKFAPLLLLFNGFWMLDNMQIFDGEVSIRDSSKSPMPTGHTFKSAVTEVGQASPVLLMGIVSFVIFLLQSIFTETLKKWGFSFSATEIEVDENLPNFFEAVKLSEADWIVEENKYYNDRYELQVINKQIQDRLDDTKLAKKPIQGIHWYRPLANPTYIQDFAYISCSVPDRTDYIVDDDSDEDNDNEQSDLTCIVLNLAFVDDRHV